MNKLKLYREALASIRNRTAVGVKVDAEGVTQLVTMLNDHPEKDDKIGSGIDYFFFKRVPGQNCSALYIMRTDGSEATFSYKACAGKPPSTVKSLVLEAMRAAIIDQISQFRRAELHKFSPDVKVEVDHITPFKQIAEEWLEPHGGPNFVMLAPKDHSVTGAVLCEPYLTKWREFHLNNAKLQLLSKHDHYKKTYDKTT